MHTRRLFHPTSLEPVSRPLKPLVSPDIDLRNALPHPLAKPSLLVVVRGVSGASTSFSLIPTINFLSPFLCEHAFFLGLTSQAWFVRLTRLRPYLRKTKGPLSASPSHSGSSSTCNEPQPRCAIMMQALNLLFGSTWIASSPGGFLRAVYIFSQRQPPSLVALTDITRAVSHQYQWTRLGPCDSNGLLLGGWSHVTAFPLLIRLHLSS